MIRNNVDKVLYVFNSTNYAIHKLVYPGPSTKIWHIFCFENLSRYVTFTNISSTFWRKAHMNLKLNSEVNLVTRAVKKEALPGNQVGDSLNVSNKKVFLFFLVELPWSLLWSMSGTSLWQQLFNILQWRHWKYSLYVQQCNRRKELPGWLLRN